MEALTSATVCLRPLHHRRGGLDSNHFSKTQFGFQPNYNQFLNTTHRHSNGVLLIINCHGNKRSDTVAVRAKETVKKKLKLLKRLSSDLSTFQDMGFHQDDHYTGKSLSELSQLLMSQLQRLKAEKKEIKRKEKEDKLKTKTCKKNKMESIKKHNAFSSESRDSQKLSSVLSPEEDRSSETESSLTEISSTASLRDTMDKVPLVTSSGMNELQQVEIEPPKLDISKSECWARNGGGSNADTKDLRVERFASRIDVCLGGKCRKLGAEALINELERKIGVEGVVVGCKCMGKCKTGPNIRLSTKSSPSNPVYAGVRLGDADKIASSFLGKDRENGGLNAAV